MNALNQSETVQPCKLSDRCQTVDRVGELAGLTSAGLAPPAGGASPSSVCRADLRSTECRSISGIALLTATNGFLSYTTIHTVTNLSYSRNCGTTPSSVRNPHFLHHATLKFITGTLSRLQMALQLFHRHRTISKTLSYWADPT